MPVTALTENFDVFDLRLVDELMAEIATDTGRSLSVDQHDPGIVTWFAKRRLED
ncbi:hypothetical protein ACWGII_09125 [Streptomyces sp. NPDC054855]